MKSIPAIDTSKLLRSYGISICMNWLKEKIRNWLQVDRSLYSYNEEEMAEMKNIFWVEFNSSSELSLDQQQPQIRE